MQEINTQEIIEIAKKAGKEILEIYSRQFNVEDKESPTFSSGSSPLTEADTASNIIINQELKRLYPEIPILSEENKEIDYEQRKNWHVFWLIDPLDGTKEFIKKNGEFTVNIALIKEGKPVLGVVYVPTKDTVYYTDRGYAFKKIKDLLPRNLTNLIRTDRVKKTVVASKSHLNQETLDFIEELKKEHDLAFVSVGSSLKLCLVAEAAADFYPRLGPTMEWDTAAAHAVVNAAGKKVWKHNSDEELTYNKPNLLNPWFIVK
jgi:3'(2'), 5'-bisphosphate nucleotidase